MSRIYIVVCAVLAMIFADPIQECYICGFLLAAYLFSNWDKEEDGEELSTD